jgi:hypothetical protein
MVNRYKAESSVMFEDMIITLMDEVAESYIQGDPMTVSLFQQILEDAGFMIVPIEDPTNLFGVQEDAL